MAIGAQPSRCRVTERGLVDEAIRDDQGVVVGLDPFLEIWVGYVGWDSIVLDLSVVLVNDACVEDNWFVSREDCCRTRPTAKLIERL